MLKGIPSVISPELIKVLMEMGHGDEIVIADGNFPAASFASRNLIRCDGHNVPDLLDAILKLIPLDSFVEAPVALMAVGEDSPEPTIWKEYMSIVNKYESKVNVEYVERFAFYDRAKKAYAIIATGESALYANIILKKGVVK